MDVRPYDTTDLGIKCVDKDSPIPLYQQVRINLLSMVQSEKLKPGDMLPTEIALAQAYHISRQTVRQAISLLESEGLLERTPGRGTTVLQGKNRYKFFLDQSFAKQLVEMGLKPTSEVLRQKSTIIDDTSPNSLQLKKGSKALELIRLRFGNDTPIGVQYTTIITDLCPDLHIHDFKTESLYNLLLTRYKLPISRIDQVVNAVLADGWHMNLLKVNGVSPLLLVTTTAFLDNGEPIETSTSYYRADKYEFSISQNY